MHKHITRSLGLALLGLALLAIPAAAESASVQRELGGCLMPGAGEQGEFAYGGVGEVTHLLQMDGRATMTCKGTALVNDSGRAQQFSGFTCYALADSGVFVEGVGSATISKTGIGTLRCEAALPTE
jgi:hypothetical protein